MDTLYIRLPDHNGAQFQVARQDALSGSLTRLPDVEGAEGLKGLGASYPHARVIALAPATDCLFTSAIISARQLKQAGNALAYLIEEQVGEDVDELHVVQAPQEAGDVVPLLVVADPVMEGWVAAFKGGNLRLEAIVPELLLLPLSREPQAGAHWCLAFTGEQAWLRTGPWQGAALEADAAPLLLAGALAEVPATVGLRLSVLGGSDADLAAVNAWAEQQASAGLATTVECAHAFDWLAAVRGYDTPHWLRNPFNLLQGAFAPRANRGLPPRWKWAIGFVAAAFVIQLGSEWVHYFYYKHQALKSQVAATELYKQLFPQEHHIVNLRRQMEGHLQDGGAQNAMLALMTQVGEGMQGGTVQPQRMDYDADSKKLSLDVAAKSLGDLEALKQKLESRGLQIEISSANAEGNGVRGRIRVSAGAA